MELLPQDYGTWRDLFSYAAVNQIFGIRAIGSSERNEGNSFARSVGIHYKTTLSRIEIGAQN